MYNDAAADHAVRYLRYLQVTKGGAEEEAQANKSAQQNLINRRVQNHVAGACTPNFATAGYLLTAGGHAV